MDTFVSVEVDSIAIAGMGLLPTDASFIAAC